MTSSGSCGYWWNRSTSRASRGRARTSRRDPREVLRCARRGCAERRCADVGGHCRLALLGEMSARAWVATCSYDSTRRELASMEVQVIHGSCHCGAVSWQFKGTPASATACNCTMCRRYGVLWAYDFEDEGISVSGPTRAYVRGDAIEFHFC